MPERALRLNGPSLEMSRALRRQHTVRNIVSELQQIYSKAEPKKVRTESWIIWRVYTLIAR